jgi:hypothetical protein
MNEPADTSASTQRWAGVKFVVVHFQSAFQQGLRYRRTAGGLRMAFIQRRLGGPKRCGDKMKSCEIFIYRAPHPHRILFASPNVYRYEDLAFTRTPCRLIIKKAHPHHP